MIYHLKAKYVEHTYVMCDLITNEPIIRSTRMSVQRKDNADILKLESTFKQCINPFEIEAEEDHLYCLTSSHPAATNIEQNLLHDRKKGRGHLSRFYCK